MKKSFKTSYEQKCFVIGITNMLTVFDAPDNIKDPGTISRLLAEVLQMLDQIKKKEGKEALKKANKQIHQDEEESGDGSDDDSDVDDSSSDDEEEESEIVDQNIGESKGSKDQAQGVNGKGRRKMGDGEMSDEEQMNQGDKDDEDSSGDEYENQVSIIHNKL